MDEGYLRVYDDDRDAALELFVDDLVSTLGWSRGEARKRVRARSATRADAVDTESGGEHALAVAADLQADLHDDPDTSTWPACPTHLNHPLWLQPEHSPGAAWTCPTTRLPVARLGELGSAL